MRRLLIRSILTQRALVCCVVLVLLATAVGLAAWPRMTDAARGRVVGDAVAQASPLVRDVQGSTALPQAVIDPAAAAGDTESDSASDADPEADADNDADTGEPWRSVLGALEAERSGADLPLRTVLTPPRAVLSTEPAPIEAPPGTEVTQAALGLGASPELAAEADLVEGQWPTPGAVPTPQQLAAQSQAALEETGQAASQADLGIPWSLPVALPAASARALAWDVGEERDGPYAQWFTLRLVGTYDLAGPIPQHAPLLGGPREIDDLNTGLSVTVLVAVDPADWPAIEPWIADSELTAWYGVQAEEVADADPDLLAAQLRRFTAAPLVIKYAGAQARLPLSTELPSVLDDAARRTAGASAAATATAAGPVGVAVAVVLLALGLLHRRRAPIWALVRARGGRPARIRALLAAEGLAIGLPVSALGWALAALLTGTVTGGGLAGWVGCAALAVLPAFAALVAPVPVSLRMPRRDLRAAGWVRDGVVLILAALAGTRLLAGGGGGNAAATAGEGTGTDPLVVLAPLALALGVAVLLLRAAPWLLRLPEAVVARRGSVGDVVGAARAARDPSLGLASMLAVLVATSTAVLATTTLAALREEVTSTAWHEVGGEVRISGPELTPEIVAEMGAIDGVRTVTPVATVRPAILQGAQSMRTTLYLLDTAALAQGSAAQRDDDWRRALQSLAPADGPGDDPAAPADAPAVLVGPAMSLGSAMELTWASAGTTAVEPVTGPATLPGIDSSGTWVLADLDAAPAGLVADARTTLALVDLEDGADATAVAALLAEASGGLAEVAEDRVDAVLEAGEVRLLESVLGVAVAAGGVLGIGALVLVVLAGAPARARVSARLRVLGAARAELRRLAAWDILPASLPAIALGAVLGALLAPQLWHALGLGALAGASQAWPGSGLGWVILVPVGALVAVVILAVIAGRVGSADLVDRGNEEE